MAQASSILFVLGAIAVAHRVRRPRRPRRPARQRPTRHRLRPGPPARLRDRRRHRLVRHASTPPRRTRRSSCRHRPARSRGAAIVITAAALRPARRVDGHARRSSSGAGRTGTCTSSPSRSRPRSSAATCSSSAATRSARSASSRSACRSPCCCTRPRCRRTSRPSSPPSSSRRCSRSTSAWRCSRTGSSRRRSRPGSATSCRARRTASPGCRRTRRSTRSPTAR